MLRGIFDLELPDRLKRSNDDISDMDEDDEYLNVQDVIIFFFKLFILFRVKLQLHHLVHPICKIFRYSWKTGFLYIST